MKLFWLLILTSLIPMVWLQDPGVAVYISPDKQLEVECIQSCAAGGRMIVKECRVACRCISNAELVLLSKTPEDGEGPRRWWEGQRQHLQNIRLTVPGTEDHYLLLLAEAVYHFRLGERGCWGFDKALSQIPKHSLGTLGHYEAVMHLSACQYLNKNFSGAAELFWTQFKSLDTIQHAELYFSQVDILQDLQALSPSAQPDVEYAPRKGAIVILTSNLHKDLKDLKHALGLVNQNVNTSMPIIIFHDGLSGAQAEEVRSWSTQKITLEFLKLKDVEYERVFEARGGKWFKQVAQGQVSKNYMHMIRFYAGMLFQHPILHFYDYYVRLDTDSYFIGPSVWG